MKKFILFSFIALCSCNNPKEPIKYYATDGQTFNDRAGLIRHEEHLREMRDLSINISLAKGNITDYISELIKLKYRSLGNEVDIHQQYSQDINWLMTRSFSRAKLDTICANNGQVYYFRQDILKSDSSFVQLVQWRDKYNAVLATLDSLDNEVGYNK